MTTDELSWQEADAIGVLRKINPNLRPGHKVGAQQIMHRAINAGLNHTDVFAGVKSLIDKKVLVPADGETNVEITEEGFRDLW